MNLSNLFFIIEGIKKDLTDDIFISNFTIDSREANNGVFIAINSGYKYIDDAINNGAKVIITEHDIDIDNVIYFKVENSLDILIKIASYLLKKCNPVKIAITGSYGKTTTKELIYNALKNKHNSLCNYGNENNLIGVLKTILKINSNIEYLILEFGMNHIGEISRLSKLVNPDIGIITSIGTSHIGYLKSKKNILKAKLEILDGNPDMMLMVNGSDKYLKKLKCYHVKKYNFDIKYKYMEMNYSIAYDLLKLIDLTDDEIFNSFNNYKMLTHRMNEIVKDNYLIIDDTYNASYESIVGGLSYINDFDDKKIIILGDILELGKYAKKIHKRINKYLKKINNKSVLLVGEYTKYIKGIHFNNNLELLNYLNNMDKSNSVIYVKGSHAMNLDFIIEELIKV